MIRISNIKIPVDNLKSQSEEDQLKAIEKYITAKYRIREGELSSIKIVKRSLDARKKQEIHYIYSADVEVKEEKYYYSKPNVMETPKTKYVLPVLGSQKLNNRPVIVGMGPAGLFCALELAKSGYCPLILERGEDVDRRG